MFQNVSKTERQLFRQKVFQYESKFQTLHSKSEQFPNPENTTLKVKCSQGFTAPVRSLNEKPLNFVRAETSGEFRNNHGLSDLIRENITHILVRASQM